MRAGGWEAPLRIDAEHLVLAALGSVPLIEVEAEGLPLSLVRAAERVTRTAATEPATTVGDSELAGALFLARAAFTAAALPFPVPPADAERVLVELLAAGLEVEEVREVLPHLPVQPATAAAVVALIERGLGA